MRQIKNRWELLPDCDPFGVSASRLGTTGVKKVDEQPDAELKCVSILKIEVDG